MKKLVFKFVGFNDQEAAEDVLQQHLYDMDVDVQTAIITCKAEIVNEDAVDFYLGELAKHNIFATCSVED